MPENTLFPISANLPNGTRAQLSTVGGYSPWNSLSYVSGSDPSWRFWDALFPTNYDTTGETGYPGAPGLPTATGTRPGQTVGSGQEPTFRTGTPLAWAEDAWNALRSSNGGMTNVAPNFTRTAGGLAAQHFFISIVVILAALILLGVAASAIAGGSLPSVAGLVK